MNHLYDSSKPFMPHAQAAPQAPKPRGVPVTFELKRAGVTEFVTSEGVKVELRIRVDSVRRVGTDEFGKPMYDTVFVVEPRVMDAMTDAMRPVGELAS